MKVLIVYWHPEPASFNAAMLRTTRRTLTAGQHQVQVSDLGALSFNPVSGRHNFATAANPEYFTQCAEEAHASRQNSFAADIHREREKLDWCDLLIFQFPLWWFSMPAIMKGWVDRVFSCANCHNPDGHYEQGPWRGRRALLSLTTGGPEDFYQPGGLHGAMSAVLRPIQRGILAATGFEVLAPFVAYQPASLDEQERLLLLDRYAARLRRLEHEAPIEVPPFGA